MGLKRSQWATLAVLLACATVSAEAQSSPPVEAFGNLPEFSSPKISPDGKYFAAIQSFRGKPAIVIYKLFASADTAPTVIPSSDWIIGGIQWVKNDRLVYTARQGVKGNATGGRLYTFRRAFATGPDAKESLPLMKDQAFLDVNISSYLTDPMIDDPDYVLAPLWVPNLANDTRPQWVTKENVEFRMDLLRVNVRDGSSERLYGGSPITRYWYTDGKGKVVFRLDQTRNPLVDHIKVPDGNDWREVASFDASADNGADIAGLTNDGKSLVRWLYDEKGIGGLAEFDIQTGKVIKPIFFHSVYDVDKIMEDEWTGRVVGARYIADAPKYVYFDQTRQALQRGLEQAFPGLSVVAVTESLDRNRVIVAVDGPQSPLSYYYLDRVTHQADLIAHAYPNLQGVALGDVRQFPYKARDGLAVDAYLTLPPGQVAKNLPVVVMPHGGPDSRDYIRFDWWAQFLVSRGYAVLQPNFRGSSGYGRKFTDAGLVEWGRKVQDDITDGVKKLIADGIADPKRICIVGASYGGYAALAGATFTPDLYACAVSVAGVSSLPEMIATKRIDTGKGSKTLSFWFSRMGSIYQDSKLLHAASPVEHADQVKVPILLMHGEDDSVVRIYQSEMMRDALKKLGKKVEFVKFKDDDHYLGLSSTRVRMLKEMERFLAEHTGSGQQSPAQRQVE